MSLSRAVADLVKSSNEIIAFSRKPDVIQNRLRYSSELEKLNRHKKAVKTERISPDSVAVALEGWNLAVKQNDFSSLSKRSVRILCSKTEIVTSATFIQYLRVSSVLSGRMIRLLVPTFQSVWKRQTTHSDLQSVIAEWLESYQGRNQVLSTWKSSRRLLIDDTAEVLLGQEIAARLIPLKSVASLYYIDTTGGGLFQDVKDIVAKRLTKEISSASKFSPANWNYLFKELLEPKNVSLDCVYSVIGKLIKTVHAHSGSSVWSEPKEQLKNFLLNKSSLRDPRIYKSNWSGIDADAVVIVIGWLSEEDIELFFQLIIRKDKHNRKKFWLRYLSNIKNSRVVIGFEDQVKNSTELNKMKNRGRSFSTFSGGKTSAFILDFGRYTIVEFSDIGACYVYRTSDFLDDHTTLYKEQFSITALKDQVNNVHRQTHHSKWEDELQNRLAQLGIRPVIK